MCGIAGVFRLNSITTEDYNHVSTMLDIIAHRGPDGRDEYVDDSIIIGGVRLAMVDIDSDRVILQNRDRSISLVYNGEIYNFDELQSELLNKGYSFQTKSDGEVIIALYELYGVSLLSRLDGMFSFGLWDKKRQKLILARDRFGIKPLYYKVERGDVVFCSELKGIQSIENESFSINRSALQCYYDYRFVAAPLTIFEGVSKLQPGCFLTVDLSGATTDAYPIENKISKPFEEGFKNTVLGCAKAETELGVYLSGGLDSSLVLAALAGKGSHTKTFTVGYEGDVSSEEKIYARIVAQHFEAQEFDVTLKSDDIITYLEKAAWHLDEPLYSTVSVSTLALSQEARKHVKGVLSGDGADELLLGYNYLLKVYDAVKLGQDWMRVYKDQIGWLKQDLQEELIVDFNDRPSSYIDFESDISPIEALRKFELSYRLPDYHLVRLDRLTMACGIEGRVPYLRNGIADCFLNIPAEQLLKPEKQKDILRDLPSLTIPKAIMNRDKCPFTSPYVYWMMGVLKPYIYDVLSNESHCVDFFLDHKKVKNIVKNFFSGKTELANIVWGLLILFIWRNQYDLRTNKKCK